MMKLMSAIWAMKTTMIPVQHSTRISGSAAQCLQLLLGHTALIDTKISMKDPKHKRHHGHLRLVK